MLGLGLFSLGEPYLGDAFPAVFLLSKPAP